MGVFIYKGVFQSVKFLHLLYNRFPFFISSTKKVNRFAVYFFLALILGTLQGILTPAYGQWQKYIIDEDINLAVSVDVADMAGDTKLDLVVTNFNGNKLILYQNNFPDWNKHIIDNVMTTFAFSGDMDGDGTMDVVACLYSTGKIVWYENNHPTWTKHIIDENTDNADFMLVADFDNDGTPDVVTAGDYFRGGDVVWYENNHPTWIEHIIESGSDEYPSLNVNDIDGDGLIDVVATMNNANKVVWFRNENNGLSWTKYTIDNSLIGAYGINSGDIDGDGTMDVVATSKNQNDVIWYENHHPSWIEHEIDANFAGANWPDIADVDGDGAMDVIVDGLLGNRVVWYENNLPNTVWTQHIIDPSISAPRLFAFSDVDGDEINDLIVAAGGNVVWYKNPTLAVEDVTSSSPTEFELFQSYPNPFNPRTTIYYTLPKEDVITITIYDMLGKEINQLISQVKPQGINSVEWNGNDGFGNPVSAGIYLYQIQAGDFIQSKKMLLLK